MVDGLANGIGYAAVLAGIGVVRELLGHGSIFGVTVLSELWYTKNLLMVGAPGAFIVLGFMIALFNVMNARNDKDTNTPGGH